VTLSWIPADNGLLAANYDMQAASVGTPITAGTVFLMKLQIRFAMTISALRFQAIGSASGTDNVVVGLYSPAGVLLTGSGNVGAQFVTPNQANISCPLTTPQSLAAGTWVWAAILSNQGGGGTQAQPQRAFSASAATRSLNLTPATARFAINGTGQTALPLSITPASNIISGSLDIWVGAT